VLPLIAVSGALLIGCAAGRCPAPRRLVDTIVTRAVDIVLALPPFLLVLVIIAGFGTGVGDRHRGGGGVPPSITRASGPPPR